MAVALKPGARLLSAVCSTELITVKANGDEVDLTIGGAPPAVSADDRDATVGAAAGFDGGAAMGKRYINDDETIELMCTKPGDGVPAIDGVVMTLKEAKKLPASD